MYEHLATFGGGPPNNYHFSLYSKWAESEWGMIITGNVQVSSTHLSLGRDITLPGCISDDTLRPFKKLASSILSSTKTNSPSTPLAILQLNHSGRQSANFIGGRYPFQRPFGASCVPVKPKGQGFFSNLLHAAMFQTPRALSVNEIEDVVKAFVKGAKVALESGFDGIQLHAAHGCE